MTKGKTLLAKLKSYLRRRTGAGDPGLGSQISQSEKLARARQQIRKKDRELARLRAELDRTRSTSRPRGAVGETSVFFILGRARSGTTWLKNILRSHPEILCRGEGWFFDRNFKREDFKQTQLEYIPLSSLYGAILDSEYLRAWISRSIWTAGEDVDRHLANLTRLAVDYFLTERLAKTHKRIVGDKTPFRSAEVVNEIGMVYPEAKVIHIIRDGRDVAVSTIHHMWNHAQSEGGIYDLEPEDLRRRDAYRAGLLSPLAESLFTEKVLTDIAAEWSVEISKAVESGPTLLGENYTEVRYEDVLARPVVETQRLLRFLGADASVETARKCVETTSFEQSATRQRGQEDSSSFFRKGVAGDWKYVFTEEDKRIFKDVAGDTLITLGYERDNDW